LSKGSTSKLTLFILILSLLVFTVAPASAITDGVLDGEDHPHVVLVLMEIDGLPAFRCTGTLIDATHVLTAGHCTNNFPDTDYSGMRIFLESDVDQGTIDGTNDYPFAGPNAVEAVRFAAHPLYETAPFFVHDVGMIQLEEPGVVLDTYGELPALNSLDALRTGRSTTFTAVGYGLQAAQLNNPTPRSHTQADRVRMVSNPFLIQKNVPGFTGNFSLLLSNNPVSGGTCFGDSGGANFLGNSDVIAGVTSFGLNPNCAGTGGVFRVDRQNVLDFIADFIANDV
jgi:hypothetical protein